MPPDTRAAGLARPWQIAFWVVAWMSIGALLLVGGGRAMVAQRGQYRAWLRIVHGGTAACLLIAFLLPHLGNHLLAIDSVGLHREALDWLRQWYRSSVMEPVLFALLLVMIGTGVPNVLHHSRGRMDGFRVVQAATGMYLFVFICSHVTATLLARSKGVETDWYFAAGPDSLLAGTSLLSRLIPHYCFATFCFVVHLACGLRVVLLQHGVRQFAVDRAVYGLAAVGLLVTATILTPLLGWHLEP